MADINNIRTLEDLTNVVSQLYYNLNKLDALYYDMFINPIPMTLELERYDENGQLTTVTLNNRAKDRMMTLSGAGSPNGVVSAITGTLYVDTASLTLYYKSTGSDAFGWVEIWSATNFKQNLQYLPVDGNGGQLTNLNADNIASGVLSVINGGSGSNNLTGLIKGNGTNPFTNAVDGVDYLGPSGMTGLVCYYPVASIPSGWLRCDGAAYSRTTYKNLFNKIGTTYGNGDGETTFNVPNLMDYYIKCWDGVRMFNGVQEGTVGTHKHNLEGTTGGTTGMRGQVPGITRRSEDDPTGVFSYERTGATAVDAGGNLIQGTLFFDAADHVHALTGTTAVNALDQENNVKNKALVPIIKY